jgi:hypothetical protein
MILALVDTDRQATGHQQAGKKILPARQDDKSDTSIN